MQSDPMNKIYTVSAIEAYSNAYIHGILHNLYFTLHLSANDNNLTYLCHVWPVYVYFLRVHTDCTNASMQARVLRVVCMRMCIFVVVIAFDRTIAVSRDEEGDISLQRVVFDGLGGVVLPRSETVSVFQHYSPRATGPGSLDFNFPHPPVNSTKRHTPFIGDSKRKKDSQLWDGCVVVVSQVGQQTNK